MNNVAVYRNRNSRCCILINEDKKGVQFISVDEENGELSIDVRKMDAREFHEDYKVLDTYPVLRAVDHMLNPITAAITITDRANKYLNQLRTSKEIAMQDQNRRTLAERNVIATHKAGIGKKGPVPPVAPCEVIEVIPGSSQRPKKGTWDIKTTPTEENRDAQRIAVRKYKEAKAKAEKKAAQLEKRKKRMTEQQNVESNNVEKEDAPQNEPQAVEKPAAKKSAPKKAETEAKKPATKEAATKTNTKSTKENTVSKTAAKKTAKTAKTAKTEKVTKATKLTKGTGKKTAAPATKKADKAQKQGAGARRGRKGAFDEGMKIKVLVKDNPKREGTAAYDTFETLRKSKTVGDFFAAGGSSASLHWNIERGYIEVA